MEKVKRKDDRSWTKFISSLDKERRWRFLILFLHYWQRYCKAKFLENKANKRIMNKVYRQRHYRKYKK